MIKRFNDLIFKFDCEERGNACVSKVGCLRNVGKLMSVDLSPFGYSVPH